MDEHHAIVQALRKAGLIAAAQMPSVTALSGGVSGDVFRVDLPTGAVCVKRPLERLRVAADWRAPRERVHAEVAWLRFAASVDPGMVPHVVFEDHDSHMFGMTFLPPYRYPGWKTQLMDGVVDDGFARQVGAGLARIHAASAGRTDLASGFANQALFHALRIEPYLLHTAKAHPGLAPAIERVAQDIAAARIALMHGDVSPKNILCGPEGPVVLDAETACYGDPAFDLAFCLAHLLLKAVRRPALASAYAASYRALRGAYLAGATWEEGNALDLRAARLLSILLLARIDGKSPVEYLTDAADKTFVRQTALDFMDREMLSLEAMVRTWQEKLGA